MKVLIVGVGLIVGSFEMGLNKKELKHKIVGCDFDEDALNIAFKRRIIDQLFGLEEGVGWADVIVLSTPVDTIKELLVKVLDLITEEKTVVDFGSTKGTICERVKIHPKRGSYVAAHPIAGTEHSGPEAAFAELFEEQNLIICDEELSSKEKLELFKQLAKDVGFQLLSMPSQEHDRHLAYISHLSHVTSFALSNTVLKREYDGEVILELAGSGFASTVRLAKSSPRMWTSIFLENRQLLLESLDYYIEDLNELKSYLSTSDNSGIEKYLTNGRQIRKILK
jgi:prephenate dehydrogenase